MCYRSPQSMQANQVKVKDVKSSLPAFTPTAVMRKMAASNVDKKLLSPRKL